MIERFNFYDLYGYLVPGIAVIVVLWLPSGLHQSALPDSKILSVAATLVVAYVTGHFIQSMATMAMSSAEIDSQGNRVYPSDRLLNKSDSTFSADLKSRIANNVIEWFALSVDVDSDVKDTKSPLSAIRQDAFFLCRRIGNESSTYAEQFQGLYSLTRGLAVAFGIGLFYSCGWLLGESVHSFPFVVPAADSLAVFVALSLSRFFNKDYRQIRDIERVSLAAFALFLAMVGAIAGRTQTLSQGGDLVLAGCAVLYLCACYRFLVSYRFYSVEFAKAVWRHFAAEPNRRPS